MNELAIVLTVSTALKQLVPGAFLLMSLYLGFFGHKTIQNWSYMLLFGIVGGAGYISLNEYEVVYVPVWFTSDHWMILALLGVLVMGFAFFALAIKSQDLDWPWVEVRNSVSVVTSRLKSDSDDTNER